MAGLVCWLLMQTVPACAAATPLVFYLPNSPPQGIENGSQPGVMAEVALEAARRAGYTATTEMLPWPRTLQMVENGQDQLIAGLSRFPSREKNYTWIFPVFTLTRSFVTTGPRIDSYADGRAKLKSVAARYGTLEIAMLQAEGFSAEQLRLITTNSPQQDLLLRGRVEALYRPTAEIRWEARSRPDAQRLVYGAPLQPTEQYIACSPGCSPELVGRLRDALKTMKADGTIARLLKQYE